MDEPLPDHYARIFAATHLPAAAQRLPKFQRGELRSSHGRALLKTMGENGDVGMAVTREQSFSNGIFALVGPREFLDKLMEKYAAQIICHSEDYNIVAEAVGDYNPAPNSARYRIEDVALNTTAKEHPAASAIDRILEENADVLEKGRTALKALARKPHLG